ncbi:hypothetical protein Trydic_g5993 [Trypoxylus dichotomus]
MAMPSIVNGVVIRRPLAKHSLPISRLLRFAVAKRFFAGLHIKFPITKTGFASVASALASLNNQQFDKESNVGKESSENDEEFDFT